MSRICGPWRSFIARRPCPYRGCLRLVQLRLMHRLNIFLSHFGHSGWVGPFFWSEDGPNPNPRPRNKVTNINATLYYV
ncbi:hypothetical protein BDZ89DRAFT_445950 [Hymenopellis radicata]|nr:hypothetical protein BDZ89DRAFT_445950 [Hymenopellis radicata]